MFPSVDKRQTASKFGYLAAIILTLIAAFLVRLPNLGESLWIDELWSTYHKLGSLRSLAYVSLHDLHPPFYTFFMFGWIRIFGDSEIAIRIPPLLFGIGSIYIVYLIASRLVEKRTALLAAFLMSVSPVHIWYSQEARPYSALIFFLLLSILSLTKLNEDTVGRIWLFVYAIAMFACVLTHFYLGIYAVLITLTVIIEKHRAYRQVAAINAVIILVLGLFVAAKVLFAKFATSSSYLREFTFVELYGLFFNWFALGNVWDENQFSWLILSIQILFVFLLINGVRLLILKSNADRRSNHLAAYLFVLPVALLMLWAVGMSNYIERSMLVALPFFFIAVARGSTGSKNRATNIIATGAVIFVSLSTLAVYTTRQDVWTVYKPNSDWRAATYFLNEDIATLSSRPEIVAFTSSDELTYYDSRFRQKSDKDFDAAAAVSASPNGDIDHSLPVYKIRADQSTLIFETMARENKQHLYLIHNRYWSGGFDAVFEVLQADSRFRHEKLTEFKGVGIHRFRVVGN